ncbi:T9SS type B sorting domain-containing protein [Flammeovirga kamogawensis]|uniref:DUF11 domain-containing protein n=1 Tax=Flammeovirga kamogawensis TaxID=373891 RepID=A0ABX8H2Z5_9BACT|nr:gliding motility-associated C-terminal domain-containing protein [Flammeovirga kamogawensis]MBB6460390.1 putative repeat protein (TIGR01451 family)/gliding motility-associated-like protein [Flammeovirga kamogawensis]QWG10196.1 DUF11 domain-containing protein [Flammeovirga kamogawensis]TRX64648.1 DUF11 domain-containing protein [Flammeovirga kamogawensis]
MKHLNNTYKIILLLLLSIISIGVSAQVSIVNSYYTKGGTKVSNAKVTDQLKLVLELKNTGGSGSAVIIIPGMVNDPHSSILQPLSNLPQVVGGGNLTNTNFNTGELKVSNLPMNSTVKVIIDLKPHPNRTNYELPIFINGKKIPAANQPKITVEQLAEVTHLITRKRSFTQNLTGEIVEVEVKVNNAGPSDVEDVVQVISIPKGLTLVSPTNGVTTKADGSRELVIGHAKIENSLNGTMLLQLKSMVPGSYEIGSVIRSTKTKLINPKILNVEKKSTINIYPRADLEISQSISTLNAKVGEIVTYTITAKNLGPDAVQSFKVIDKFINTLEIVGLDLADPETNRLQSKIMIGYPNPNDLTWNGSLLRSNETKSIKVKVKVKPTYPSVWSYQNTAEIKGSISTSYDKPFNNISTEDLYVTPTVDLGVEILPQGIYTIGSKHRLDINVMNWGESDATDVKLKLLMNSTAYDLNSLKIISSNPAVTFSPSVKEFTLSTIKHNSLIKITIEFDVLNSSTPADYVIRGEVNERISFPGEFDPDSHIKDPKKYNYKFTKIDDPNIVETDNIQEITPVINRKPDAQNVSKWICNSATGYSLDLSTYFTDPDNSGLNRSEVKLYSSMADLNGKTTLSFATKGSVSVNNAILKFTQGVDWKGKETMSFYYTLVDNHGGESQKREIVLHRKYVQIKPPYSSTIPICEGQSFNIFDYLDAETGDRFSPTSLNYTDVVVKDNSGTVLTNTSALNAGTYTVEVINTQTSSSTCDVLNVTFVEKGIVNLLKNTDVICNVQKQYDLTSLFTVDGIKPTTLSTFDLYFQVGTSWNKLASFASITNFNKITDGVNKFKVIGRNGSCNSSVENFFTIEKLVNPTILQTTSSNFFDACSGGTADVSKKFKVGFGEELIFYSDVSNSPGVILTQAGLVDGTALTPGKYWVASRNKKLSTCAVSNKLPITIVNGATIALELYVKKGNNISTPWEKSSRDLIAGQDIFQVKAVVTNTSSCNNATSNSLALNLNSSLLSAVTDITVKKNGVSAGTRNIPNKTTFSGNLVITEPLISSGDTYEYIITFKPKAEHKVVSLNIDAANTLGTTKITSIANYNVIRKTAFSIKKTIKNGSITPNIGDEITYQIEVKNIGPSYADNVEIMDVIPTGLKFVSASGGSQNSNYNQWVEPTMEPSKSYIYTIKLKVLRYQNGIEYINWARVSSSVSSDKWDNISIKPNHCPIATTDNIKGGSGVNTFDFEPLLNDYDLEYDARNNIIKKFGSLGLNISTFKFKNGTKKTDAKKSGVKVGEFQINNDKITFTSSSVTQTGTFDPVEYLISDLSGVETCQKGIINVEIASGPTISITNTSLEVGECALNDVELNGIASSTTGTISSMVWMNMDLTGNKVITSGITDIKDTNGILIGKKLTVNSKGKYKFVAENTFPGKTTSKTESKIYEVKEIPSPKIVTNNVKTSITGTPTPKLDVTLQYLKNGAMVPYDNLWLPNDAVKWYDENGTNFYHNGYSFTPTGSQIDLTKAVNKYTIKVTNNFGCEVTLPVEVNVDLTKFKIETPSTVLIGSCESKASNYHVKASGKKAKLTIKGISAASNSINKTWSTTTNAIDEAIDLPIGIYQLTLKDYYNNITYKTFEVKKDIAPSVVVTKLLPNGYVILSGGSVTLQTTTLGKGLTHQWSIVSGDKTSLPTINNTKDITVTPSQSTIYQLEVTDKYGCTFTEQIGVLVDDFQTPDLTISDCETDVDYSIQSSSSFNNVTTKWTGNNLTSIVTNISTQESNVTPGSYEVIITDNFGNSIKKTFNINKDAPLSITKVVAADLIIDKFNTNTTTLDLTLSGAGPFDVTWSRKDGRSFEGSLNQKQKVYTKVPAGRYNGILPQPSSDCVYEVEVKDRYGKCVANTTFNVFVKEVDLIVKKSLTGAAGKKYQVGDIVEFKLEVTNKSTKYDATKVKVEEYFPSGLKYMSVKNVTNGTFKNTNNTWEIPVVSKNSSESLLIEMKVLDDINYINKVKVSSYEKEIDISDNSDDETVPVENIVDLQVEVDFSLDKGKTWVKNIDVNYNDQFYYRFRVSNNGKSYARGVKLLSNAPQGYSISNNPLLGSVQNIHDIPSKQAYTVTEKVIVNNAALTWSNAVSINYKDGKGVDQNKKDNGTVKVNTPPVAIKKNLKVTVNQILASENVVTADYYTTFGKQDQTYDIDSRIDLNQFYFEGNTTPGGIKVVHNGTFEYLGNGNIKFTPATDFIGDVEVGFKVKDVKGAFSKEAKILVVVVPIVVKNKSLIKDTDLQITQSVSNLNPNIDDVIDITLLVENMGPTDATLVKVNDIVPSGYQFISASLPNFDFANSKWTIGSLKDGDKKALTVKVKVLDKGVYLNEANVSGFEADLNLPNNFSRALVVPNKSPVAILDYAETGKNVPIVVDILSNDFDLDGTIDTKTIDLDPSKKGIQRSVTIPNKGTFTVISQKEIKFFPVKDYEGDVEVKYVITDNDSAVSEEGAVLIKIVPGLVAAIDVTNIDMGNCASEIKILGLQPSNSTQKVLWIVDKSSPIQGKILSPVVNQREITVTEGDYLYEITDRLNNITRYKYHVVKKDAPIIKKLPQTITMKRGETYELDPEIIGENLKFTWSDATYLSDESILETDYTPTKEGKYSLVLEVKDKFGCITSQEIKIEVKLDFFIPEGFSPNNDNIHDKYVIEGLSPNAEVKMEVYNRWEQKVYTSSDYKNDWDGKSNIQNKGEYLADGTYFAVISIDNKVYKKYITIKK